MVKKRVLTAALIVAGMASVAQAQILTNLLANGGFEDDGGTPGALGVTIPSGWGISGSGTGWVAHDTGYFVDAIAVKLWTSDSSIYQDVAVAEGLTYQADAQAIDQLNDPLVNRDVLIKVEWFDSGMGSLGVDEVGRVIGGTDASGAWKNLTAQLVSPAGAETARIIYQLVDTGADPRGAAYADEFSFGRVGSGKVGLRLFSIRNE
ncbi:MAG: hypothetical protein JEZ10_08750 [Verrucomicrobia bacterium]|nr:hypothetical protein [Verrucomicrobiota bacterium]